MRAYAFLIDLAGVSGETEQEVVVLAQTSSDAKDFLQTRFGGNLRHVHRPRQVKNPEGMLKSFMANISDDMPALFEQKGGEEVKETSDEQPVVDPEPVAEKALVEYEEGQLLEGRLLRALNIAGVSTKAGDEFLVKKGSDGKFWAVDGNKVEFAIFPYEIEILKTYIGGKVA